MSLQTEYLPLEQDSESLVSAVSVNNGIYSLKDASARNAISGAISAIDEKSAVYIDDRLCSVYQQADLSIVRLSSSEYDSLVQNNALLSNAMYIVEETFINAYQSQIKNLLSGTDLSDAVNVQQLCAAINSTVSDYYLTSQTSSAVEISNALSAKSTVSFSQTLTAGTSIGSITIDGSTTQMYAPAGGGGSNVYVSADYQAGTHIATIGVDSISTEIYTPGGNEIDQVDSADAADLLVMSRLSSSGTYETRALSVGALSSVFCTNDVFNAALGDLASLIHSI